MVPLDVSPGQSEIPELMSDINTSVRDVLEVKGNGLMQMARLKPIEAVVPGQPAIQRLAVPWAVLWPIVSELAPSATHAVMAKLAQVFAPKLRPIVQKYATQLRQLMDPGDFDTLMSVIKIFLPDVLAPHLDPDIRPMFGSTFTDPSAHGTVEV
jgi:hypothetical protein